MVADNTEVHRVNQKLLNVIPECVYRESRLKTDIQMLNTISNLT